MASKANFNTILFRSIKDDLEKSNRTLDNVQRGPLSLEDRREVNEILDRRKCADVELHHRAHLLETSLRGIRRLQALNRSTVAICQHAVAPVNRLPKDLVRILLKLACGDGSDAGISNVRSMLLTRVCKQWRSLVTEDSSFWTSISLSEMTTMHLMKKSLEWSNERPLTVEIAGQFSIPFDNDASPASTLLAHSSRWQNVRINGDAAWDYLQLQTSYPSLTALRIEDTSHVQWSIATPCLTHLSIERSLATLGRDLPWQNLHTLALTPAGDSDLRCILLCTKLSRLELTLDTGIVFLCDDTLASVKHLSVKVLVIRLLRSTEGRYSSFDVLIGKLDFPSLTELSINDENTHLASDDSPIDEVERFVRRSRCRLQSLEISRVHCLVYQIFKLLRSQPSIIHLGIHDPALHIGRQQGYSFPVSPELLKGLDPYHPMMQSRPMLPNLQSIELTLCSSTVQPDNIIDMVGYRRTDIENEIVPILSVRLNVRDPPGSGWGSASAVEGWGTGGPYQGDTRMQWADALSTLKMILGLYVVINYWTY